MTKSREWAYEEEVRVCIPMSVNVFEGKKYSELEFHNDELKSVFLGCKMSKDLKADIFLLAKARNPQVIVYQMIPDPYEYKLSPLEFAEG